VILIGMAGALATAGVFFLKHLKARRREALIARQLRRSLQSITQGLRAGLSFLQTLERTAQDEDAPLGREWLKTVQSVRVGTPLHQALVELGQRVPSREMNWFVVAVQVAQETGGSLSGVLDTLAQTLQEREILRDKIAALTAQGKASGLVLAALPFLMLVPLTFLIPGFMRPVFTTTAGQGMLAVVTGLVAAGGFVIYRIVTVRLD